ncbi:MAG: radical SAM protein [Legionella sp.]|nr:radical SAM protein [Legionella sp.]
MKQNRITTDEIKNVSPTCGKPLVMGRRRIAVAPLDGKIPNLAIMKIIGYHEKLNDEVSFYDGLLFAEQYDKIYFSKLFSFTPMPQLPPNAIIGGTGIDFFNRLPKEIEDTEPSYSLYPNCNYHLGFSMKGCRFNCKFCCVPKKEGRPYNYNTIDEILTNPNGGNRLMLLDNDFFGGTDWKVNLERIIEMKLKVCFVQGLNIRIITDEQAELLSKCNYQNSHFNQKYLTFAWDKYNDGKIVKAGIERCIKAGIPARHMQFFVLVGFDSTPEQDLERVMTLHELGCMPFVMPYDKSNPYQAAFARWVNHRATFKSCNWSDYKYKSKMKTPPVACP